MNKFKFNHGDRVRFNAEHVARWPHRRDRVGAVIETRNPDNPLDLQVVAVQWDSGDLTFACAVHLEREWDV